MTDQLKYMRGETTMDTKRVLAGPILVPLDGSAIADQALAYANALAPTGCQISLLRVVPDLLEFPSTWQKIAPCVEEAAQFYKDAATKALTTSARQYLADHEPGQIETLVEFGQPADQILKVAARIGAPLIIMSSYGLGTLGRPAFGSVADRVSRGATMPVLLMRPQDLPETEATIKRIIVPLDGSPEAESAIGMAIDLARHLDVPVQLTTVVDPTRDLPESPAYAGALAAGFRGEIESGLAAETRAYLHCVAGELIHADVSVRCDVRYGSTAQTLIDEEHPGDLIVMTSHGRSGQPHWQLGGIATRLLRDGTVPVLRVRPVPSAGTRDEASPGLGSAVLDMLTV
jgi:nucleotide-binding universal stress UspA family protein